MTETKEQKYPKSKNKYIRYIFHKCSHDKYIQ